MDSDWVLIIRFLGKRNFAEAICLNLIAMDTVVAIDTAVRKDTMVLVGKIVHVVARVQLSISIDLYRYQIHHLTGNCNCY